MPSDEVPTWDGDPAGFEGFATSCRWYEASLKDSERKLAAPRVWQKLGGAAKSVVRHLDPAPFTTEGGMGKLLSVLRESPLQKLPVPDSFNRLEKWSGLRRATSESIPQLLVREEELFVELQQALQRARAERLKHEVLSMAVGADERDPPTSPTRSPNVAGTFRTGGGGDEPREQRQGDPGPPTLDNAGFFENELRGYRLLKASKLSAAEKQHVMTLTKNSTHFQLIRNALRSLFADGGDGGDDAGGRLARRTVWFAEDPSWDQWEEDWWADETTWGSEEAYWGSDWSPSSGWDYIEDEGDYMIGDDGLHQVEEEGHEQTPEETEGERRLEEAYAIAAEANKTLAEAKQAVARVRAARGYYNPVGMKGNTTGKGKGKTRSPFGKGKGSGGTSFGPCFICGQHGHSYVRCPDRWSKGSSKGSSSTSPKSSPTGKSRGKSKFHGKGRKGKAYWVDFGHEYDMYEVNVLTLGDETITGNMSMSKVVIDTGATESVSGVRAMARLIDSLWFPYDITIDQRPRFRFGNGEYQRATSHCMLTTAALGQVGFFLLDGGVEDTPPLVGAKTMRSRKAVISYHGDYIAHQSSDGRWWANTLQTIGSGHLVMDLSEPCIPLHFLIRRINTDPRVGGHPPGEDDNEDDDGDGGGGDGARRKRKKTRDLGSEIVAATARHATRERATGGVAPPRPPPIEPDPESDFENYTPSQGARDSPHREMLSAPSNYGAPPNPDGEGKDSEETRCAVGALEDRIPIDLDEGEHEGHEVPEAVLAYESHDDVIVETLESTFEHALPVPTVPTTSEALGHVLQHDDCQSAVITEHSVLMISEWASAEPEFSLSDRLSNLARRLDELRTSIPVENEAMPTGDRDGSEAHRLAMPWTSCSRSSPSQQGGELAVLRTLRPSTPIHHQGIWYGGLQGHWSSTRPSGAGSDGVAGELQGPRDQRKDLQREAHGDPWPLTGGDERQRANNGAGQSGREAGRSTDGQCDLSPRPGLNDPISGSAGDCKQDLAEEEIPGEAHGEAFSEARDQDRPQGGGQGERQPECEGHECELKSVLLGGNGRLERSSGSEGAAGEGEQRGSPAHQERAGGEGQGSRVMALWESLKSLRCRMRAAESIEKIERSDRLEATQSDNPTTSNMSPIRSTSLAFEEIPQPQATTSTTNHACATCLTSSMAQISPGEAAYDRPTCMLSSMTRSSPMTTPSPLLEKEIAETNHMVKKAVRPSLAKRLAVARHSL